jgi:hypothetical protein
MHYQEFIINNSSNNLIKIYKLYHNIFIPKLFIIKNKLYKMLNLLIDHHIQEHKMHIKQESSLCYLN